MTTETRMITETETMEMEGKGTMGWQQQQR